ncbi:OmpP1/FadL family transporter [Sphingomonas sp. 3-13AW]|uniref:OmpP1/FadL family transporter n=1 Tax=Sphingomonas sp. 3-13AW TaxID=3050450 RepID=UPI003BB6E3A8
MSPRIKISLLAAAPLWLVASTGVANAQAFYLQEQSARAAGRAFSGEVADTGPQSLWWNPASIAGMENAEAAIAVSAILPRGDVVDNGTVIRRPGGQFAPVGGNPVAKNPINNGFLPSGAIAMPLNERVSIGLAVTSPYSFTTNYDADSWARYTADKTRLRTIDIQPSIGVSVTDWLRVGAAVNVEYTDAELGNKIPNLSATLPDGEQILSGNGWDLGWTAGLQMHNSWATVGISYKSAIEHNLKGSLEVSGLVGPLAGQNATLEGVKAKFKTPAQIIVGGRFRTSDALTLNVQGVRYTWADFDAIRLGAPLNQAIPENYRNSWSLAGGFDYAATPDLTLRAGLQRTLTPTRDGNRDARVPDSNRWNFGAGGSYRVSPAFTLDGAFNYVAFKDETIDRPTIAAGSPILVDGRTEDAKALIFTLGGRVSF